MSGPALFMEDEEPEADPHAPETVIDDGWSIYLQDGPGGSLYIVSDAGNSGWGLNSVQPVGVWRTKAAAEAKVADVKRDHQGYDWTIYVGPAPKLTDATRLRWRED